MSSSTAAVFASPCPHELRPGTAVCLHCRREAREAHKARVRRIFLRVGATALALAACAAAAVAIQRPPGTDRQSARGSGGHPGQRGAPRQAGSVAAAANAREAPPMYAATAAPSPRRAAPPGQPSAPLRPAIAEGRTPLRDGMFAERRGDTVTVFFDTELARTRRPEKFEQIVRATLPAVYGPAADSLLAGVPAGAVASAGDLLTELPARGIHLPASGGRAALDLWPTTRPGRDGLLVVTYRVIASR